MIAALRRRHGRMIIGLACILPVLYAAALALRTEVEFMPSMAGLSGQTPSAVRSAMSGAPEDRERIEQERKERDVSFRIKSATEVEVRLSGANEPDTYLYWSPETPEVNAAGESSALSAAAVLIGGPLGSGEPGVHSFTLPAAFPQAKAGEFLLFSVAQMRIVARQVLRDVPERSDD